jgi:hypothetical protein
MLNLIPAELEFPPIDKIRRKKIHNNNPAYINCYMYLASIVGLQYFCCVIHMWLLATKHECCPEMTNTPSPVHHIFAIRN